MRLVAFVMGLALVACGESESATSAASGSGTGGAGGGVSSSSTASSSSTTSSSTTSTSAGSGGGGGGEGGAGGASTWAPLRFAAIGDFGFASASVQGGMDEAAVAELVAGWNPEFVVTVGDNNYPDGSAATIDENIGQFYHSFIAPYSGTYGPGADKNRFFPAVGNHEWVLGNVDGHTGFFTLPGNERYYDVTWGPLHLFVLDSDPHEPDGTSQDSVQGQWLQAALASSTDPFRLVVMHHPPYSSGAHGSSVGMQWPFYAWGADLVMAGHDHDYERLSVDGKPYVVNGMGGADLRGFDGLLPESQVSNDVDHGAVLMEMDANVAHLHAITTSRQIIDSLGMVGRNVPATPTELVPMAAVWSYRDDGSAPTGPWTDLGFDASSWKTGAAPLGYGIGNEGTVVDSGADPNNKYVTTYFRREFQVDDAAKIEAAKIAVVRDDGIVVYLNGTEIFRTNLPAGATSASTLAEHVVGGASETSVLPVVVDPSLFRSGANALAVEMHQATANSSDLRFALELAAKVGP